MQIEVTVRHDSIADEMKDRAKEKAGRLLKYYDKIQSIRVVLNKGGDGFSCELIVNLERTHDLVAHAVGHDLHAVIDQAVDRLERQLIEYKDRTRHRKGRGPSPHQPTRT
ncbi:MAG TPA: ribosome-associated translation inhibitor RaiA [Phycisphaerae bacterium]|nr:ribosome-associated translation inhibitor RaiA [Phycisphaerae bacterium]